MKENVTNMEKNFYLEAIKKTKNKKEKGITLIALVITIIVILILARYNNCSNN